MLTFHANPDLAGYKILFDPNFYNTNRFIQHQRYDPLLSFYILDEVAKEVFAMIHFTQVGEFAFSLPKSPFGGFEYDASIDRDTWINFVQFFELKLKKLNVRKIIITEAPGIYRDESTSELLDILTSQRYKVTVTDLNHFVSLEEIEGIKQLHSMERRHFRKSLAKNYKWKLESNDALPEVYSFIERCREQQDLKVNISYVDITSAFKVFPGKYRIMSVRHLGSCF
ncbi:MAG: hypothetical protein O2887_15195 [Bacteroidetes bacterium]|nr:hypothetical protein [Bacteroidota bacterium]